MIQLQRLEGFYWVARTEGYARAARAFPYPITQPGVHQQVKRLEEELGVLLFERVGKDRVVLTPQGRALYQHIAPFLESLRSIESTVRGGTVGGVLRIGAPSLVVRHVLPQWLRRLRARRADIELVLTELRTTDVELLRSGEVDLLVDHFETLPGDLGRAEVATGRVYLIVPSDHPVAHSKRPRLGALGTSPLVAYNDPRLRKLQLDTLARHAAVPQQVISVDTAEAILGFVAAGLGYSLVPALGGAPRAAGVFASPLELDGAEFSVHALWRKSTMSNPLVDAALAARG